MVSEGFELFDEAFDEAFGVAGAEVVAAEVVVELAGGEHVPAGDEDGVFDGAEGFLVAAARFESRVLRGEGIRHVAMISGDRRSVAERVGRELGVDRVYAEQSPEDIPTTRSFFELTTPNVGMILTALLASALSIAALDLCGFSLRVTPGQRTAR